MTQENVTVLKEPQTGSNGASESKKISKSKQHFELKTVKHFEKKVLKDDISEKEWFNHYNKQYYSLIEILNNLKGIHAVGTGSWNKREVGKF